MKRRDFIKQSAAVATSGLSSSAIYADTASVKTRPPGRPFATCRNDTKLVAMYCNPEEVLNHPEYLDSLQRVLGVNVINIMGQGVTYPPGILSLLPFPGERSHFIGLRHQENDDYIHKCAEILHTRNIDMWLYGTGLSILVLTIAYLQLISTVGCSEISLYPVMLSKGEIPRCAFRKNR